MKQREAVTIFWFRRDLRLDDNTGLFHALNTGFPVLPIFIFDSTILDKLDSKWDRRVDYFHQALQNINDDLKKLDSTFCTFYGEPFNIFKTLLKQYDIQGIYCNRDYEPTAIKRDTDIAEYCKEKAVVFKAFKDQVIFDRNDILKNDGTPYTVYTPYAKNWRHQLSREDCKAKKMNWRGLYRQSFKNIHTLADIGFQKTDINFVKPSLNPTIIDNYDKRRDFPAENGTSRLAMALRYGTISIRKCVEFALDHNNTWLSELIWREFFMQILYHYPKVIDCSFKNKYDFINWRNNEQEFELWCAGKTGFALVDAGMRQLNQTGYMHNRVRMVAASFLVKDLLIDWRWGESYFAAKLNDYDLSSNNGNWQWVAGCGCDAAPYFRIFNPETQALKFDSDLKYIRQWIPEFGTNEYPKPMVDHKAARLRALTEYKKAVIENKL